MMLTKDEVDEDLIRNSRIFHFGTLSSTHEGVREATRYALTWQKKPDVSSALTRTFARHSGNPG